MAWPRAILLDFYGTVVAEDDVPVAAVCEEIAAASSDNVTREQVLDEWSRLMSRMCLESHGPTFRLQRDIERASLGAVLRRFHADLDVDALLPGLFDYWQRPPIFPESKRVIEKCHVPVCLVTNIDNADLACALAHHGLRFEMMVTSEDCRAYKPRAEPFRKALSLLGLTPRDVLHVGDSITADVRGAKALGIPVMWLNRRQARLPENSPRPDHIAADLTAMLSMLGR